MVSNQDFHLEKKKRCIFFFYLCLILTPLIDPQLGQERRVLFIRFLKNLSIRENLCLAFNNCLVGDIGLLMGSQNFVAEIWDRNTEASWLSSSYRNSSEDSGKVYSFGVYEEGRGLSISHPPLSGQSCHGTNRFPKKLPVSPDFQD